MAPADPVAARVFDLMLDDKIVTTYDSRGEAEDALRWYVDTYGPPSGRLYVQENHEAFA